MIALADEGVRSSVVRLPAIAHSPLDHHGFAPALIAFARQHGVAVYLGGGTKQAPEYVGFLARFADMDNPTSAAGTRDLLGREPTHPGLLEDLADGFYFRDNG